jgi:cytochrome c oxidase subunit III
MPAMAEPMPVQPPYRQAEQRRHADLLGMWLFLASEGMLFGGVFLALAVYRLILPQAMKAASAHLDLWAGGANTAVLLTSSLTMALAVRAAQAGKRSEALAELAATAVLGVAFEAIKLHSWWSEYLQGLLPGHGPPFPLAEPGARMFFHLYFVATGLHALHLAVGITVVTVLTGALALRPQTTPRDARAVEVTALYWHLVDIVWIFLYPVLYLIAR